MMRRHHENRISFDFPRDGKQNQFASLTKTIPSRSNRKAVTLPLIYHKSFMIHRGDRRGNSPFCWKSKNQEVFGVSLPTFFTQESRRGVERAAPQKTHPIKHKKIPAQIMQGFFIYPSLSKQLGPDLWHQRVFTHRYIVTKVFCLFSVP